MYSHYLPDEDWILLEDSPPQTKRRPPEQPPHRAKSNASPVLGEVSQLLGGLTKRFHLEDLDIGDILLVLILLFLFSEGDNSELVITLGLLLLLGLDSPDDQA